MQDVESLFRNAVQAHESGRADVARGLYTQVLERAPAHAATLFRVAMLEFQAGKLDASLLALEKATQAEPDNPELRYRFAQVLMMTGANAAAVGHLQHGVRVAPGDLPLLLKLGEALLGSGEREQALVVFQRALVMAPQLGQWRNDPKVASEVRQSVVVALGALQQKFAGMADECLRHVREHYPGEDLRRLEAGVNALCGVTARRFDEPGRRPALLGFPGLPQRAFFEREEFDWSERVEDQWRTVRDELQSLVAGRADFQPYCEASQAGGYRSAAGTDWSSLEGSMTWNSYHFHHNSRRIETHCAQCPATSALMDSLPMPRIRNQSPEVFFSRLGPGGHIVPHHGLMNVRLTVHLGLVVPEGCDIRVWNQTRGWHEGGLLFFDDSYEHEARNRSDVERVVLIFEAWNPALSEAERAGVEQVFKLRRDWLDQFETPVPGPTAAGLSQAAPAGRQDAGSASS